MELPLNEQSIKRNHFVGIFGLALMLTFVINGALPQLQMALFSGNIIISSVLYKFALIGVAAFYLLIDKGKKLTTNPLLLIAWFAVVLYLIVDAAIINQRFFFGPGNILNAFNAYYFFLLVFPFVLTLQKSIDERSILNSLLILFVPLGILGTAQYLLSSPIVPTLSNDGEEFKVFSSNYYESVRAFSLFTSGYAFGHFIALVGAIVITYEKMNKAARIFLFCLVIVAGYSTLTRNSYLEITSVMIAAFLIKTFIKSKVLPVILTAAYGFIGYSLLSIIPKMISAIHSSSSLLENDSLLARTRSWASVENLWLNTNDYNRYFGTGKVQVGDVPGMSFGTIDNMFYALGLHIGIIGLILWLLFMISVNLYVFHEARTKKTPLSIATAAFMTSWMLVSMFNLCFNEYFIAFFILLISKYTVPIIKEKNKNKSQVPKLLFSISFMILPVTLITLYFL